MGTNGQSKPTVVRTSRGLTVGGTRLTIYSLIDHFKAGDSDELVQDWYRLTAEQVADVHRYIDEHRDEVEAEYQEVLRYAEEQRRYWEKGPKSEQQKAIRARIDELRTRLV